MTIYLKFLVLTTLLVSLGLEGQAQSAGKSGPPAHGKAAQITAEHDEEVDALQNDVTKMRGILNQMQANFSLVGNPTLPANHELELNIDMWRIVIDQMEHRIQRLQKTSQRGKK